VLAQAGARVLGCIVNKQDRSRSDMFYPYYGSDERDGVDTHDVKKVEHSAPSPTTSGALKKSQVQFR
jgi:hypothetical protein